MSNIDLTNAHLTWCLDILNRIKVIMDSKGWSDEQKLVTINWLVKQALKAEREE
jgi:hypothetical protein